MKKSLLPTALALVVLFAAVEAQPAQRTLSVDASGGTLLLANREQPVSEFVVRVNGGAGGALRLKVNGPDMWNRDLSLEGASGGQNEIVLRGPRLLRGTYTMTISFGSQVWRKTLTLNPAVQLAAPLNLSAGFTGKRSLEVKWSPVEGTRIYQYCLSKTDDGGGSCFDTQETTAAFPATWNYQSGAKYFVSVYARNYDTISPKPFPQQTASAMAQTQTVAP